MAKGKRNRASASSKVGLCVHVRDGKCKYLDRRGSAQCAKNRCNAFADPKDPKHKR